MTDYLTDALLAAQALNDPRMREYVREQESMYLALNFGWTLNEKGKVR